jgi:hypothetical protein
MERLAADYRSALRIMPPDRAREVTEARWTVLAQQARNSRTIGASSMFVLGGLLTLTGTGIAIGGALAPSSGTPPAFWGYFGALTATMGVATAGLGALLLLIDSPLEQSLHLWRAGHEHPPAPGFQLTTPNISVSQNTFSLSIGGRF